VGRGGVVSNWKFETARYQARVDGLGAPLMRLRDDLKQLPMAPLAYRPSNIGLIKYQLCLLVAGGVRSACELVQSTQLLWRAGRFLSASLNIRLLMEIWGALAYSEAKVLQILDESGDVSKVSGRIEKLFYGFESGVPLPWGGVSTQSTVNVADLMKEADAMLPGSMNTYRFLCDACHPTFLQYTYLLLAGANYEYWGDKKFAVEAHDVLDRALHGAETAVHGMQMVSYSILRNALPLVLDEAARTRERAPQGRLNTIN
jgi:hypothetical protein